MDCLADLNCMWQDFNVNFDPRQSLIRNRFGNCNDSRQRFALEANAVTWENKYLWLAVWKVMRARDVGRSYHCLHTFHGFGFGYVDREYFRVVML